MYYIQLRSDNQLETIDQFETRKEAQDALKNYMGSEGHFYISARACKVWRESEREAERLNKEWKPKEGILQGFIDAALGFVSVDEDLVIEKPFTVQDLIPCFDRLQAYVFSFIEAFPEFCQRPDLYRLRRREEDKSLFNRIGHNLWLTACERVGNWWDGGWSEFIAKDIAKWCQKQDTIELYLGDDGLIHVRQEEIKAGE